MIWKLSKNVWWTGFMHSFGEGEPYDGNWGSMIVLDQSAVPDSFYAYEHPVFVFDIKDHDLEADVLILPIAVGITYYRLGYTPILVECLAGCHRSVAVASALHAILDRVTVDHALERIRKLNPDMHEDTNEVRAIKQAADYAAKL